MSIVTLLLDSYQDNSENNHQSFSRPALINSVDTIPSEVVLTPVIGKRPLRNDWQHEPPIPRDLLRVLLKNGQELTTKEGKRWRCQWDGYGVRTGDVSNGLIALDIDGPSAVRLFNALQEFYEPLPKSVAWTSGKEGRSQIVFQIPDHYRERFKSFTRKDLKEFSLNGENIKRTGNEAVDFRYNDCQSVLPPSKHPETGLYRWINSFDDCEVAIAPDWLCEFILGLSTENEQKHKPLKREYSSLNDIDENILEAWIKCIPVDSLDWYEYCTFLFALHHEGYSESDALSISQTSSKHTDRGFYAIWKNIKDNKSNNITAGTLYHFAVNYGGWKPKTKRKSYCFDKQSVNKKKEPKKTNSEPFEGIKREAGATVIVGERAPYLQGLINNRQSFLDVTLFGLGKSHTLQYLENPEFGGKIFILCADPANFSVQGVTEKYTRLIPRHNGYYEDSEGKLKKAPKNTPDKDIKIEENCPLTPLFGLAKNKGYDTTGSNPICNKCEFKNKCQVTEGWYMRDRRKALEESKYIICHPEALIDYALNNKDSIGSHDIAFVDEPSMAFKPTFNINTTRNDSILEVDNYRGKISDEYHKIIDDITQAFKPLYDNKEKYGLDNSKVMDVLSTVVIPDDIDVNNLINQLTIYQHDIGSLVADSNSADGKKYQNNPTAKAHFAEEQIKETASNIDKLPSNTLPLLLRALTGDKRVYLRIQYGKLIVTESRVEDYSNFLDKFSMVGFFETTTTSERLRLKTGFKKPLKIIYSPDINHNNQTIHAISMSGIKSINITDTAVKRINLLSETLFNEHGKFSRIGHKKLKEPVEGTCNTRSEVIALDGHYGADNIGSNRYEGQGNLMFMQLPFANKGDLMAEYSVLNDGFNEELFDEYWKSDMWEKLEQGAVGRQRAVRHKNKTFKTFLIYPEGFDLTRLEGWGIPIIYRDAFDVEPKAGDENQVTFFLICCTAWELLNQGLKPTLAAIAELMTVNGSKITLDGVSKAVTRRGYDFREYMTKLEKLYSAYIYKHRLSIKIDFCHILQDIGWDWLSDDTSTDTSVSDEPTPKINLLDLIKETVNTLHSEGIIPSQKLVVQWLSEKKGHPITQSGLSKYLSRKGIKFADLIPTVEVESEIVDTSPSVDIPTEQNKVNLDGQNSVKTPIEYLEAAGIPDAKCIIEGIKLELTRLNWEVELKQEYYAICANPTLAPDTLYSFWDKLQSISGKDEKYQKSDSSRYKMQKNIPTKPLKSLLKV